MLKIKEILEEKGEFICITNQGILKKGTVVVLDEKYKGDLNRFFLNVRDKYIVCDILKDSIFGGVTLFLNNHPEEPIYYEYLNISSLNLFNVYKWKGYYILADSLLDAQLLWEKSNLEIKKEDYLLFPKQLHKTRSESLYPSIVDEDLENILFELKK